MGLEPLVPSLGWRQEGWGQEQAGTQPRRVLLNLLYKSAADQNASAVMEGFPKPWLSYLTMGFG